MTSPLSPTKTMGLTQDLKAFRQLFYEEQGAPPMILRLSEADKLELVVPLTTGKMTWNSADLALVLAAVDIPSDLPVDIWNDADDESLVIRHQRGEGFAKMTVINCLRTPTNKSQIGSRKTIPQESGPTTQMIRAYVDTMEKQIDDALARGNAILNRKIAGEIKAEFPLKDIQIVAEQSGVSHATAIEALHANNGDIVSAIMKLTM